VCESEPNTVHEVGKGFNGLSDDFYGNVLIFIILFLLNLFLVHGYELALSHI